MIDLLIKSFCKNSGNQESIQYRTKVATLCSIVGIVLNILLFAVKLTIGVLSGSISIMADAYNNITDAGTSAAMMFGVKLSSCGAGDRHPTGHGRFEWIISTLVSFMVVIVGWGLLQDSFHNLHTTTPLNMNVWMILIMILSIGVKTYMYLYNHKYGKRFQSEVMKAVAKDSISDAVATGMVVISVIISSIFHINIDGICGIAVALFIIFNGFSSIYETGGRIMGTAPSDEELDQLRTIILKHECIREINELLVEDYGMSRGKVISKVSYGQEDQGSISGAIESIKQEILQTNGFDSVIMAELVRTDEETESILHLLLKELKKCEPCSYIEHFRVIPCGLEYHIYCDICIQIDREQKEDMITAKLNDCLEKFEGYTLCPSYKIFHSVRNKPWAGKNFAKRYDEFMKSRMFPKYFGGSLEKHHEIMKKLMSKIRDKRVLDVAAGTCDAINFLDRSNSYTAMDISPELLEVGKTKMKQEAYTNSNFMLGNACCIPSDDAQYDVLLCNLAMQLIMPSKLFLKEVKRVLTPAGIFIGSVPVMDHGKRRFQNNRDINSSDKLRLTMESEGFIVKLCEEYNGAVCYFTAVKGEQA